MLCINAATLSLPAGLCKEPTHHESCVQSHRCKLCFVNQLAKLLHQHNTTKPPWSLSMPQVARQSPDLMSLSPNVSAGSIGNNPSCAKGILTCNQNFLTSETGLYVCAGCLGAQGKSVYWPGVRTFQSKNTGLSVCAGCLGAEGCSFCGGGSVPQVVADQAHQIPCLKWQHGNMATPMLLRVS